MFSSIRRIAGIQSRNYAKKGPTPVALRSLKPKSSGDTVSCMKLIRNNFNLGFLNILVPILC